MVEDKKATAVINRFSELKNARSTYEHYWQDIRELVRVGTSDFQAQRSPGDLMSEKVYDGTAPQALQELAAGLHSFLTSPSERWFELHVEGMDAIADDHDALLWLEEVADIVYDEYSLGESNWNSSMQEIYPDVGAFGTAVLNQEYRGGLKFKAFPLANCYIDENADGRVDVMYRKNMMTVRQMVQRFGEEKVPEKLRKDPNLTNRWEVIHAVEPRMKINPVKVDNLNMPYGSIWTLREPMSMVLEEKGYRSFPYHVPRWNKLAEEVYGRGPAIECLPDIKMLNRMEYTVIKAATKAVDPPLVVPSDGFFPLPLKTAPGSLNFAEPGAGEVMQLPTSDKIPLGVEYANQKREFIRQCFFADWFRMEKDKVEMTAYEVADRRDEKLRFLAPMLGRLTAELLTPMISRSYELLRDAGRLRPPPASLAQQTLKVVYVSAAARAQKGGKAINMGRYLQELIPMAQVQPDVMDAVNTDSYAQELAIIRQASRKVIRQPEEIAEIRAQRAQKEQAMAIAQNLEPASKAVKNLADANEKGNIF